MGTARRTNQKNKCIKIPRSAGVVWGAPQGAVQVFPSGSDALRIVRKILFVPEYNTWGGRVEQRIHPPIQTCRLEEIKKRKKEIFKTHDF
jgi:hypothetical protein